MIIIIMRYDIRPDMCIIHHSFHGGGINQRDIALLRIPISARLDEPAPQDYNLYNSLCISDEDIHDENGVQLEIAGMGGNQTVVLQKARVTYSRRDCQNRVNSHRRERLCFIDTPDLPHSEVGDSGSALILTDQVMLSWKILGKFKFP